MGSAREVLSFLWAILTSRWYWIIVTVCIAIIVTPFAIVMLLVNMPAPWNFAATMLIIIAWGVVSGYKDWIIAKAKEEKRKAEA